MPVTDSDSASRAPRAFALEHVSGTLLTSAAGLLFYLIALATDVDVFERFAGWLERMDRFELDEFLLVGLLVLYGLLYDLISLRRRRRLAMAAQDQREAILRATTLALRNLLAASAKSLQSAAEQGSATSADVRQQLAGVAREADRLLQDVQDEKPAPPR